MLFFKKMALIAISPLNYTISLRVVLAIFVM